MILYVSMLNDPKAPGVVDLLLEACPPHISDAQFTRYQTRLLADFAGFLRKNVTRKACALSLSLSLSPLLSLSPCLSGVCVCFCVFACVCRVRFMLTASRQ
jgi:hypothetical protein